LAFQFCNQPSDLSSHNLTIASGVPAGCGSIQANRDQDIGAYFSDFAGWESGNHANVTAQLSLGQVSAHTGKNNAI
jgi:hypothetical protein